MVVSILDLHTALPSQTVCRHFIPVRASGRPAAELVLVLVSVLVSVSVLFDAAGRVLVGPKSVSVNVVF